MPITEVPAARGRASSRSSPLNFDFANALFRLASSRVQACIDLHEGRVKQIVGGSLSNDPSQLRTSKRPARWYAELYNRDRLKGGHIIMLGPGNEAAAREALRAYLFIGVTAEMVSRFRVHLHCFVLMDNHYHPLPELTESNLRAGRCSG